ncbi:MAG TPA: NAD(+) diphosphatase [Rubrobacter sp.]|nr:NAD(+) diphosphatase [Rubrobacter sp.]
MAKREKALWFAFRSDRMLVLEDAPVRAPLAGSLDEFGLDVPDFRLEIGELGGHACWAVAVSADARPPEGMVFEDLRALFYRVDEEFFRMAGRAKQIVGWHASHRFCGRCGGETKPAPGELAMRCTRCGMMHFPRLSPAAIVLVRRGDRILLAHSPGFPQGLYSVLAGFVEPGESIEEAVVREVREEVGIEVTNVRYFGSQPWPFPSSLMIGFTADYKGGDLVPQPGEIEDAGWYTAVDLPQLPPKISIARAMIDDFVSQQGLDPEGLQTPG